MNSAGLLGGLLVLKTSTALCVRSPRKNLPRVPSTKLMSHDPIGAPVTVTCAVALNTSSASAGAAPAIAHGATLAASNANSLVVLGIFPSLDAFPELY